MLALILASCRPQLAQQQAAPPAAAAAAGEAARLAKGDPRQPPALYKIVKVQTPALRAPAPWDAGVQLRFAAHNFVAVIAPDGRVVRELHGIARGPRGEPLAGLGGVRPFAREYIWGESYDHRTGFYDETYPQAVLFTGSAAAVDARLTAAADLQRTVNRRAIRYAWPATSSANSNAYYTTLLAAMGLADVRADHQLWAPSAGRLLVTSRALQRTWL
ncbi:hypothetical protein DJ018_01740 [Phenylobacterium deserti]|uniref:Uncharacterized protein n=2 Tax=Phenylobacterium deserti TaxID=1914756 RepID=A0A328ASR8_9CAUL|nr:hypothetical protein DJ018_01740 [Phenylobacterium deserti]